MPYVVGFAADDYAECEVPNSVGCNLVGQCGHGQNVWAIAETHYELLQDFADERCIEFRERFSELLCSVAINCPVCGLPVFFGSAIRVLKYPQRELVRSSYLSLIRSLMNDADYDDGDR